VLFFLCKKKSDGAFSQSIKFKMTLKNTNVIHEMNEIFDRMHARLDHRFQQLIRQINIHTNSINYSRKKSKFN
jgi:hypothetical protein